MKFPVAVFDIFNGKMVAGEIDPDIPFYAKMIGGDPVPNAPVFTCFNDRGAPMVRLCHLSIDIHRETKVELKEEIAKPSMAAHLL